MDENLLLAELVARTLSDLSPNTLDAVWLVGETVDNEVSVLNRFVEMANKEITDCFCVSSREGCGFAGCERWIKIIYEEVIDFIYVEKFDIPEKEYHTGTEARNFIKLAKEMRLDRLGVIAAPFHQTRSFCHAVTAAMEYFPECKLYSIPGTPLNWNKEVLHSQGVVRATRRELFSGEMERIIKYSKSTSEFIAPLTQILDYLDKR